MTPRAGRAGAAGRRRGRWIAVWAGAAAGAVVLAFAAGALVRSPWDDAVDAGATRPEVTAVVEHRSLVLDTAATRGEVRLGTDVVVPAPAAEPVAMVTAVRVEPGQRVDAGAALADVAGRPVIAWTLPFGPYRDLVPGDEGPDVREIQTALTRSGHYGGAVDGVYGTATARAVDALYAAVGAEPPPPEADAVEAAARTQDQVRAATEALAAARAEDGSPTAGTTQAAQDLDRARREAAAAVLAASTPLPRGEIALVPESGAVVTQIAALGTDLSDGGVPLATLRAGVPQVLARVGVTNASAFSVGTEVEVRGVDGTARAVATVSAVSEFRATATDAGQAPGYDLQLELDAAHSFAHEDDVLLVPLEGTPALEGLAVPLTAIRDDEHGAYVLVSGGAAPRKVEVDVEGTAQGWAVVSGRDLEVGDLVVVQIG
ncbi:peptidoglycan-binding protein [Cellulomonas sp. ES6]|uniref:peptidoglycan-binding domain-containing protein n=1 Tax=Cellulomonas sp. ES6 TaxID=3039384 RepID=UPI0024B65C92|nr:peptidoglycan-binding protein [Cellulomonas sp. ES6]WHP18730.1 peptidoglycan-binding domain-containing protein [Cellulomonas sp. ES6]